MIFITACGIGWYLRGDIVIPIHHDWEEESSSIWINIFKPCKYYRFQSQDNAKLINDWLLEELDKNDDWERGMQIDSAELSKILISRNPQIDKEKLNSELIYWSTPSLGGKYAQSKLSDFAIIVRSHKEVKEDQSHSLHYKISSITNANTVIELWDYWTFH